MRDARTETREVETLGRALPKRGKVRFMIVPLRMAPPSSNTEGSKSVKQYVYLTIYRIQYGTDTPVGRVQRGETRRRPRPLDGRGLRDSCCAAGTAAFLLVDCAEQSRVVTCSLRIRISTELACDPTACAIALSRYCHASSMRGGVSGNRLSGQSGRPAARMSLGGRNTPASSERSCLPTEAETSTFDSQHASRQSRRRPPRRAQSWMGRARLLRLGAPG